jgi:sulfite exporter TauE/SafE
VLVGELLGATLLMGLFGGTHCAVMCGSASSVICAAPPPAAKRRLALVDSAPPSRPAGYAIAFNLGRIASYTLLGAAVGMLGRLPLALPLDLMKLGFRVVAVLTVVAVGLHLVGIRSFVGHLESVGAPLWRRVAPLAKRLLPLRSAWHALAAGGLWAFMPCGLLYAALAVAATEGTPENGALAMAAFGIGTLPVMAGIGLLAGRMTRAMSRLWIRRAAGAVVLALGLWSTAGLVDQLATYGQSPHACCPRP